jgi:transcriptional adapter 2-alpha
LIFETDLDTVEDERAGRSMGVIRKKTATRGTEGGTKYHCDVCSIDITSTVGDKFVLCVAPDLLMVFY